MEGKRLAEGAHHQVDLIGEPKVRRRATAAGQHPHRVRVIDHQACTITVAECHDLGQRRDVAAHAKDAVDHHQRGALFTRLQHAL
jgi:hypothetical protein